AEGLQAAILLLPAGADEIDGGAEILGDSDRCIDRAFAGAAVAGPHQDRASAECLGRLHVARLVAHEPGPAEVDVVLGGGLAVQGEPRLAAVAGARDRRMVRAYVHRIDLDPMAREYLVQPLAHALV